MSYNNDSLICLVRLIQRFVVTFTAWLGRKQIVDCQTNSMLWFNDKNTFKRIENNFTKS